MRRVTAAAAIAVLLGACAPSTTVKIMSPARMPTCHASVDVQSVPIAAIAVDADGHVCWETKLFVPSRLVSEDNPYAVPVADERLGFYAGGTTLEALSFRTGQVAWRWSVPQGFGLLGVSVAAIDDGIVVVSTPAEGNGYGLVGLDESDGKVRWTLPPRDNLDPNAPVLTGDGGLAVTAAPPSAAVSQVIDVTTGRLRWSASTASPHYPSNVPVEVPAPVVDTAGVLTSVSLDGSARGIDDRTGRLLWTRPNGYRSAAVAGDVLLLIGPGPAAGADTSVAPSVTAVDPTSGRTLWSYRGPDGATVSPIGSTPSLVLLADNNPGRILAVERTTGHVAWSAATSVSATTATLTRADLVTVTEIQNGRPGVLVDRSTSTGAIRWQQQVPTQSSSTGIVASSAGPVVVATQATSVTAYRLATGVLAWTAPLPPNPSAKAVPIGGGVLIESPDSNHQFEAQ